MNRRSLLLSSLALGCASFVPAHHARARPAYGSQPLVRLADNRPGLMVHLNGHGPFLFLVDTATSHTVVVPALRERLALPEAPGPATNVITAAGSVRSHIYRVSEIATAGVIVEGGRAVVVDLPPRFGVSGVLGADFLQNFTVDLNLGLRKLTLYPEGTHVQGGGLQRLRGRLNGWGFIVVPAQVENIAVSAIFDSGAEFTVANPALATMTQRTVKVIARVSENKIVDAARKRDWAETVGFSRIALGPISWRQRQIMIADMRVFEQIGLARSPAIFVGMDLMAGRRVVLDYAGAALALSPQDDSARS